MQLLQLPKSNTNTVPVTAINDLTGTPTMAAATAASMARRKHRQSTGQMQGEYAREALQGHTHINYFSHTEPVITVITVMCPTLNHPALQ